MKRCKSLWLIVLIAGTVALTACGGGGGGGGGGTTVPDTFAAFGTPTQLSNPSGGNFSAAVAINDGGTVVGLADAPTDINKAALWTVDAGAVELSARVLESLDNSYSAAYAVDDAGNTVGESSNGAGIVPVIWPVGLTTASPLPLLAGPNGAAYSINAAGAIAGEAQDANLNMVAVVWSNSAAAPGALAGLGGPSSAAYYLNDSAEAVGEAEDVNGVKQAAFWDLTTAAVTPLPMLNATDTAGIALSINLAGEIAGEVELADGTRSAVLWRPDGGGGYTATDLGPTGAAAINNGFRIVGNAADTAVVWDTRSAVISNNNLVVSAVGGVSQAYGLNDDNLVVGIRAGRAFVVAPQ
jgi:uncharacterized membrane protein